MESSEKRGLEFPCECVSAKGGYSDPWAPIAQNKLLPNGTKEGILNLVAEEPRTIAQLAALLQLSRPSVLTHVNEMMTSELLRESEEWEKKYPAERYYEPNFPVISAATRAEFEAACKEMAQSVAELFEQNLPQLEETFAKTELAEKGWKFADIAQYLFAKTQRAARMMLEENKLLSARQPHRNGISWLFWTEETDPQE